MTKEQFLVGLARGATANLSNASRMKVFEELFQHAGVRLPDPKNSLNVHYDVGTNTIKRFDFAHTIDLTPESLISSSPCDRDSPVVPCLDVAMNSSMFLPWLERGEPFIVVGPEGCGKSMLLRNAMASLRSVDVATVHCSARTSAENIIQKIQQSCAAFSSSSGRVYRPKSAERLILYLKDLNMPKPDKYDTIQLIAFLQQLISYSGFYDGLEWVGFGAHSSGCKHESSHNHRPPSAHYSFHCYLSHRFDRLFSSGSAPFNYFQLCFCSFHETCPWASDFSGAKCLQ